jgi:hypothetical protein
MKKYMIEREIPKIGSLGREQLQQGAAKSNQVLRKLDRIFSGCSRSLRLTRCTMYLAKDELIRRHADLSGFPATRVTEIGVTIDPTTAA